MLNREAGNIVPGDFLPDEELLDFDSRSAVHADRPKIHFLAAIVLSHYFLDERRMGVFDQFLAEYGQASHSIPQAQFPSFGIDEFEAVVSPNGNEVDTLFCGGVIETLNRVPAHFHFAKHRMIGDAIRVKRHLDRFEPEEEKHRPGRQQKGKNLEAIVGGGSGEGGVYELRCA